MEDDPEQIQQGYEVYIGKVSLLLEGLTRFKLKSKAFLGDKPDVMVFSTKAQPQYNRKADEMDFAKDAAVQDSFQFLLTAEKFYLGFFMREFDTDLDVKLQSVALIDRTPMLDKLNGRKDATYDPNIDDVRRY